MLTPARGRRALAAQGMAEAADRRSRPPGSRHPAPRHYTEFPTGLASSTQRALVHAALTLQSVQLVSPFRSDAHRAIVGGSVVEALADTVASLGAGAPSLDDGIQRGARHAQGRWAQRRLGHRIGQDALLGPALTRGAQDEGGSHSGCARKAQHAHSPRRPTALISAPRSLVEKECRGAARRRRVLRPPPARSDSRCR